MSERKAMEVFAAIGVVSVIILCIVGLASIVALMQ